ncbi:helix-turn-helix domain-containing protein [Halocatena marina]|uniref:helix-turn-helix domain-containing protein n=1 Tax=Halocatena marina TaxID=2934937 RepID=UPI00200EB01D|nr:helix-turn-helix domain-containing protein [Halocatena marina]
MSIIVVEALQRLDGAGVSKVSKYLETPKSTVHDHLWTLEQLALVVNEDGVYKTGPRFLDRDSATERRRKSSIRDVDQELFERFSR